MEWSGLTTAALAVSTIPASYNFVLMVFPVCVMAGMLLRRRQYGWLAALAIAFLGIGYPLPVPASVQGLAAAAVGAAAVADAGGAGGDLCVAVAR